AHPGFGYLFGMPELRDFASKLPPGEFARAYGNRRTGATAPVLPAEAWATAAISDPLPDSEVCFGAATGIDGIDTSIGVSTQRGGDTISEIVDHRPGTTWALERLIELTEKYKAPAAIDRVGPSA